MFARKISDTRTYPLSESFATEKNESGPLLLFESAV